MGWLRQGIWVAVSVVGLTRSLAAQPVVQDEAPPGLELVWSAPSDCPSRRDLLTEIEKLRRGASFTTSVRAEAEVVRVGKRFRLSLRTWSGGTTGARTFEGSSCPELAETAAVVLTMMARPTGATSAPPSMSGSAAPSLPPAVAPTGVASALVEASKPRDVVAPAPGPMASGSTAPSVQPSPAPAALVVVSPTPAPTTEPRPFVGRVIVSSRPRIGPTSDPGHDPAKADGAADVPAGEPPPKGDPSTSSTSRSSVRFGIGLASLLAVGSRTVPGIGLHADLRFRSMLVGVLGYVEPVLGTTGPAGLHVEHQNWALEVRGGPVFDLRHVRLHVLGGAQTAWLQCRGTRLDEAMRWGLSVGAGARWPAASRVGARLDLGVVVPLEENACALSDVSAGVPYVVYHETTVGRGQFSVEAEF